MKRSYNLQVFYERLWSSLWMFLFVLILETVINVHFLSVSTAGLPPNSPLISVIIVGIKAFVRGLFWAVLFLWLSALPSKLWLKRIVNTLLVILAISIFFFEEYLITMYGTVYTNSIILAMAGTNSREAIEYADASLSVGVFLFPIVALIIVSSFVVFIYRQLKENKNISLSKKPYLFILSVLPIVFGFVNTIPETYTKVLRSGYAYEYTISPFDRLLWNSYGFYRDAFAINKSVEHLRQIDLGLVESPNRIKEPHNLVIIIGETLRRDYMHCYGYTLDDTPKLDSLIATGNLVPFSDVVSPAPNTIESLTKVLTFQTNEDNGKWYNYPALPHIFSQNGYWVHWCSNQESSGTFIQPINTFAQLSNERNFVNARGIDEENQEALHFYDGDVLPSLITLDSISDHKYANLLQIVHLQGSHPVYEKRYPQSYARFTADSVPVKRSSEKDKIVATYINSVYYNDYIVSSIIEKYSKEPSIVIYFSDHGEILYDNPDDPEYYGHGMTKEALSIPFMVYVSPEMQKMHPEIMEDIKIASSRPIMIDLFTHTLCDFIGIKTKYSNPKLNFLGDGYDSDRPRVIRSFSQEIRF